MKAKNIEEYLGTLQSAMKESWKSHLKTHKYSDHKALNEFYDDIVDLVDSLIEGYQGLHGVVDDLKNIMSTDKMDAVKYLEELREMTEEGKKEFIEEDELKSDVDAILSLIDQTLYKLKELKESGMVDLKDYLMENLFESIDNMSAEKMVYDILAKNAGLFDADVDDDKLRDLANAIVDAYEKEGELRKHNKSNFAKYLEEDGYFNILSVADTSMDQDDHELIYKILGAE